MHLYCVKKTKFTFLVNWFNESHYCFQMYGNRYQYQLEHFHRLGNQLKLLANCLIYSA